MLNNTLTANLIIKEANRLFKNNTPFLQGIYRDFDGTKEASGSLAGESIRIRKPMRYIGRRGKTAKVQPNTENFVTLDKTEILGVDLNFSSAELSQDINRFSELYLVPAMNTLASILEVDLMTKVVKQIYNQTGTLGTDPASFKLMTDTNATMTNYSTPTDGMRSIVLNPDGMSSTVDALKGLFQDSTKIRSQYMNGQMGRGMGLEFAETSNVYVHTNGTSDGNYLVNGAGQTGSSIAVDTGTGTYKEGDIITFPGVKGVNRITRQVMNKDQQFVLTADYAGGAGNIQISPAIVLTGSQQTVNISPTDNNLVTEAAGFVAGAQNAINLAYHKNAFAFGTVALELPGDNKFEARSLLDSVSMRLLKVYDGINDDSLYRIDILSGIETVIEENACRVAGA